MARHSSQRKGSKAEGVADVFQDICLSQLEQLSSVESGLIS